MKNGRDTPRHTIKSLKIITIPINIKSQKKTIFIRPSTFEKFSCLILKIAWIKIASNLPPSSAGIGKTLKNAKASESIAPNQRKINIQNWEKILSQNLIAPTGPVNWLRASLLEFALKEKSLLPIDPRADIVIFHSHLISLNAASIAFQSGYFIGSTSIFQ